MNGFLCTFVGAALAALALLEMCDLSRNEKDILDELKNELNAASKNPSPFTKDFPLRAYSDRSSFLFSSFF